MHISYVMFCHLRLAAAGELSQVPKQNIRNLHVKGDKSPCRVKPRGPNVVHGAKGPTSATLISTSTVDPSHVNCLLHALSHLNGVLCCSVGAPVD